ncbi:MAG: DUF2207 domain-containing protein, partial [Clostridia bacterium]|nr:DUF2207 domain-containing protein [Clostridia bacterium]
MKKTLSGKGIFAEIAALFLALVIWAGVTPPVSVSAEEERGAENCAESLAWGIGTYSFNEYNVDITVNTDGTAKVTERMAVQLSYLHGIIRDFALGDGVSYRNLTAKCDNSDFSPYVKTESSFLSYYLRGNGYVTGERVYTVEYEMKFEKLRGGYLPLNVIGYGNAGEINNVTVHVTVPDGLQEYQLFSGKYGTKGNSYAEISRDGNVLTVTAKKLPCSYMDDEGNLLAAGITLDMQFAPDTFTREFDFSILYSLLIGVVLLGAAALVKVFVCKQPLMTVSVNLEAPDEMDPMTMGLLIDGKVDSEDIGSLVFWLA